jgi:hypothetical protein
LTRSLKEAYGFFPKAVSNFFSLSVRISSMNIHIFEEFKLCFSKYMKCCS